MGIRFQEWGGGILTHFCRIRKYIPRTHRRKLQVLEPCNGIGSSALSLSISIQILGTRWWSTMNPERELQKMIDVDLLQLTLAIAWGHFMSPKRGQSR